MLTPQEVSTHVFAKARMGGYNMAMVDEFLDTLTEDYTKLFKENAALKAKLMGKRKAVLEREKAEYAEKRRSEEMNVTPSKDFLLGYHLEKFETGLLRGLFDQYQRKSGKRKQRFDAGSDALDVLFRYLIPVAVLAIGAAQPQISPL